jgi:SAM-dependent methyltransferase
VKVGGALEIRVTASGMIGRVRRLEVTGTKLPKRLCLALGAKKAATRRSAPFRFEAGDGGGRHRVTVTASFDPRAYWEERLGRRPGREGVGHAGLGEGLNGWMYRVRRRVFLRAVTPLMDSLPSWSVLDVGSGTGFYVDCWRELGAARIAASDIAEVAVERLREANPRLDVERFDLRERPPAALARRRFGAISAMEVVFHLLDDADYERAFATLFDLLEPGGVLVFSENFLHDGELRVPHQRSRTLAQIERVVRGAGFEVLSRRPQFWLMNEPHDSGSRVRRLWWRLLAGVARRSDRLGSLLGAMLFEVELAAVSVAHEGPSTELMVCRRPR